MQLFKRIALIVSILLLVLVGATWALTRIFKPQILAKVKQAINAQLNAKVDFADASLSMLRHFPNLDLDLQQLTVTGQGVFAGVPLAAVEHFTLTLNLSSVLGGDVIEIKRIQVRNPKIHVLVTRDGQANYLITKPTASVDTTAVDFKLKLAAYQLSNAEVIYDDAATGTYAVARGINHQGKGDFTAAQYDLSTNTQVDSLTVRYGGMTYLQNATADLQAQFLVDQPNSKYTLRDNDLLVNALRLKADGWLQLLPEAYQMDLQVQAPESDFRNLFSVLPGAYTQDFAQVKSSGQFNLAATVKGQYSFDGQTYPAVDLQLGINNGSIKYPNLPLAISRVFNQTRVLSPGSDFDQLRVDVSDLRFIIGSNAIQASFGLRTPLSDPAVNAKINGKLNLAELAKAYPLPSTKGLQGRLAANLTINARQSQIEQQRYDAVAMRGDLQASQIRYQSSGLPPVYVRNANASFSPQFVELRQFDADLGRSDVRANGRIDNILAFFSPRKTMTGQLQIASRLFDANEWLSHNSTAPVTATSLSAAPAPHSTPEVFDRFKFALDGQVGTLRYDEYEVKNLAVKGQIEPNQLRLENIQAQVGPSDLQAKGLVTGLFDYLFKNGKIGGTVDLQSHNLDLNPFMTTFAGSSEPLPTEATPTPEYGVLLVPDKVELSINARANTVQYTNMTLKNFVGTLQVAAGRVDLREVRTNLLGGALGFAGVYDTQDPAKPYFNVKLDLQKMDFQETFNAFNTFRLLAPIGKFVTGLFNTSMILEGSLGNNMMPQLQTLNAEGFLETINGLVKGLKPLEQLANSLKIEELKRDILLNTKNWLEIKNGAVEVKPFTLPLKNQELTIAGSHGITGDMSYTIKTTVPRQALENTGAGQALTGGLKQVEQQAAKMGINLNSTAAINVLVTIGGRLSNPKLQFNFLPDGKNTGTVVSNTLENEKAALEAAAKQQVAEATGAAKVAAQRTLDSIRNLSQQELAKQKAALGEQLKQAAQKGTTAGALDSLGSGAKESAEKILNNQKAQEEINRLKKDLNKFNPFGRKPKTDTLRKN